MKSYEIPEFRNDLAFFSSDYLDIRRKKLYLITMGKYALSVKGVNVQYAHDIERKSKMGGT
jgi:hypothetical protein